MSWRDAVTFCSSGRYSGLASIHSYKEQRDAHDACLNAPLANGTTNKGNPHACWIGLNDDNLLGQHEGQFAWQDGTDVDYMSTGTRESQTTGATRRQPAHLVPATARARARRQGSASRSRQVEKITWL
jgi:hypothetical protein